MNDDERIDFGPLDPSRDRERWRRLVASVAHRAGEPGLARQLVDWGRPALLVAAALALLVWTAALLRPPAVAAPSGAAALLSEWAQRDEVPATTKILEVLGGEDGPR